MGHVTAKGIWRKETVSLKNSWQAGDLSGAIKKGWGWEKQGGSEDKSMWACGMGAGGRRDMGNARSCPFIWPPSDTSGKEPAWWCRRHKRYRFDPWVRKIPWRRAWQHTPVFSPGESPWTEETGRLQPIGSHRVGHDWSTWHVRMPFCRNQAMQNQELCHVLRWIAL